MTFGQTRLILSVSRDGSAPVSKVLTTVVCGATVAAAVYWAARGTMDFANRDAFGATAEVVTASAPASNPTPATGTTPGKNSSARAVDIGNTKCIVSGDDVSTNTVEYQGKLYHLCCSDCLADFKKDPAKYVKALEADPAKYGVKK